MSSNNSSHLGQNYNRYGSNTINESNLHNYEKNNFNNVFSQNFNQKLSLSAEPDIHYEEKTHYIAISSKNRNLSSSPNVNKYIIQLPTEIRNIYSIELIQAIIPAKNNVQAEPYLLLEIDEIKDVLISSDTTISNSFAMLALAAPITNNGFIQIDNRIHENTVYTFTTPKAVLSKMTISIKNSDGDYFDFGANSNTLNKDMQNTFIFKIIVGQKKRQELNQRNVY